MQRGNQQRSRQRVTTARPAAGRGRSGISHGFNPDEPQGGESARKRPISTGNRGRTNNRNNIFLGGDRESV